jgi:hypothetical protein
MKVQRIWLVGWFMVFKATFNNISVLLMEETRVPGGKNELSQVTDKLFHIMLHIEYISPWTWFELTTLVVIGTDCTGSCKSKETRIANVGSCFSPDPYEMRNFYAGNNNWMTTTGNRCNVMAITYLTLWVRQVKKKLY